MRLTKLAVKVADQQLHFHCVSFNSSYDSGRNWTSLTALCGAVKLQNFSPSSHIKCFNSASPSPDYRTPCCVFRRLRTYQRALATKRFSASVSLSSSITSVSLTSLYLSIAGGKKLDKPPSGVVPLLLTLISLPFFHSLFPSKPPSLHPINVIKRQKHQE